MLRNTANFLLKNLRKRVQNARNYVNVLIMWAEIRQNSVTPSA